MAIIFYTVIAVLLSTTVKNGFHRRCYREAIGRRGISFLRNGSTACRSCKRWTRHVIVNHFDDTVFYSPGVT